MRPSHALPAEDQATVFVHNKLGFTLVTSLFFMWGLMIIFNSALVAQFQGLFDISRAQALLVETAFYLGYFVFSVPAGVFIHLKSCKAGILLGLLCYAAGAFLFLPAAKVLSFELFLFALFVIAAGLAFLETASNLFATEAGSAAYATQRINLAQSCNGCALIIGPFVFASLIFAGHEDFETLSQRQQAADSIVVLYGVFGVVVLCIAILFLKFLPREAEGPEEFPAPSLSEIRGRILAPLRASANLRFAIVAQFFYVGVQSSVWGLTLVFISEVLSMSNEDSSRLLPIGTGLFVFGRLLGTGLLSKIPDYVLLLGSGVLGGLCQLSAASTEGRLSVGTFLLTNVFMSIQFPTIFSLGVRDLDVGSKRFGSSLIVTAIAGGGLVPPIVGALADATTLHIALLLNVVCFAVVTAYAYWTWRGSMLPIQNEHTPPSTVVELQVLETDTLLVDGPAQPE